MIPENLEEPNEDSSAVEWLKALAKVAWNYTFVYSICLMLYLLQTFVYIIDWVLKLLFGTGVFPDVNMDDIVVIPFLAQERQRNENPLYNINYRHNHHGHRNINTRRG